MTISNFHIRISLHKKPSVSYSQPSAGVDFVPVSLFQHLPAQTPKPTVRKNATYNASGKDYRLGPIRIDWVDFEDMNSMKAFLGSKEKEPEGSNRSTASATFIPHPHTKSGSTNLPEGVVHVFRDKHGRTPAISSDATTQESASPVPGLDDSDNLTLAVLAVPSWMNPSDFLTFVAPAADGLQHLRMIRDSAPNRSIAILKFRQEADATEFAEAYNGKAFNSMEPETCHVVGVTSVWIDADDSVSQAIAKLGEEGAHELPTCPVCLERMDSAVTGLVTVPCSHTFHCVCLSKWGDSRCPVCRYSQTLLTSHPASSSVRSRPVPFGTSPSTPALSTCADCSSTTNLWICLVCGNIGCGRYGRAHAHAHYSATTHVYALELETQRVWDYAGDGYVHRLIQNRADGKLVELPSASMAGAGAGDGRGPSEKDALGAEKIEAIGIEYSYLLTSQLDSQREWYEEQANGLRGEVEQMRKTVETMKRATDEDRVRRAEEARAAREEEQEHTAVVDREKARAEKKAEKMAELARKLDKELKEERAVSEGLLKNLGKMKEKVEEAEIEKRTIGERVRELEDQVRDVMFFLEAKTKIEEGEGVVGEAAGGSIELPSAPARTNGKKKKSKK